MNLFKKPKAAPKAKAGPKLMKVFLKDFRVGGTMTIICQPGLKHPDATEWFDLVPVPANSPAVISHAPGIVKNNFGYAAREAKSIKVVFRDGTAEVSQALGHYLIGEMLAHAKPQKPCNWTDPRRYTPTEAEA